MGKKIFAILLVVFLVLGLVYLVFLNSKIIKNDSKNLGGSHYLILDTFVDGSLTNTSISTGGSEDTMQYVPSNYFAMFSVFDHTFSASDYTLTIFFDLPSIEYYGNITPYIIDMRLTYGWGSNITLVEDVVKVDKFEGTITKSDERYPTITIEKGSRFLIEFDANYIIDTYVSTFDFLKMVQPKFDYVDGSFEISDIGNMLADLFYYYPAWLISHITLPFKALGGIFEW